MEWPRIVEIIVFSGAWAPLHVDFLLMRSLHAWRRISRLARPRDFERLRRWLVSLRREHLALRQQRVENWYVFQ